MPNTAVKPANAESTWGEAPWEDRKPLIKEKSTGKFQCFFAVSRQQLAASKGAHVGRPFGIMGVPIIHDKRCGTRRLPIRPGSPGDCRGRPLTSQTAFGGQLPYKGSLGRPAVIFDHSLFRMMVSFYELRTTNNEPRLFSW